MRIEAIADAWTSAALMRA